MGGCGLYQQVVHLSHALKCDVTKSYESFFSFLFFTYFFGHDVQVYSAPAYDDHIHSMLSQLWQAEVQAQEDIQER